LGGRAEAAISTRYNPEQRIRRGGLVDAWLGQVFTRPKAVESYDMLHHPVHRTEYLDLTAMISAICEITVQMGHRRGNHAGW
jgi:hypothetical protein